MAAIREKNIVPPHKALYEDPYVVMPERAAIIERQGENILRVLRQFGADAALVSICKYAQGIAPVVGGSIYVRLPSDKPVFGIMEEQSKGAEFTPIRKKWEVPPEAIGYPVNFEKEGLLAVEGLDFSRVEGEEWDKFRACKSFARIPLDTLPERKATYYLGIWSLFSPCFTKKVIAELTLLVSLVRVEMVRNNFAVLSEGGPDLQLPDAAPVKLLFGNPDMLPVQRKVLRIAPTNSIVLIMGDTGTGKELVARAIHTMSGYSNGELVSVNCGAIPESLLESELFGHEKGAFTGAHATKKGFFEQAHGGTIFLDEIGELSLNAQIRLLRVLETKEIRRVGGTHNISIDCRVIAATNRDLAEMVNREAFRKDLWYRLNVFPIMVPALRYRLRDISVITNYFVETKYRSFGLKEKPHIHQEAFEVLLDHNWPGNVRELENVVDRALITYNPENGQDTLIFDVTPPISKSMRTGRTPLPEEQVPPPAQNAARFAGWPDRASMPDTPHRADAAVWPTLDELVTQYIKQAMEKCGFHIFGKNGAAALLGMHPTTLQSRWKKIQEKEMGAE